ncbi:hypothetical protein HY988_05265 [Candidatus Micrarchaeota archaeon]|nr:hypothetical protein [Candidatus Micrarchaeota archaeon]
MDLKLLEEIGLTQGEVKVYLALLRIGATKTGPLSATAGVSSSKVYKMLDRLERKGLVGHIIKGEIKYFTAMEPKRLLDFLDEREKQLQNKKAEIEKMLPELEKTKSLTNGKTEAVLYEGFRAVTNFFRNIVDELEAGETYYVIGGGYGKNIPKLQRFFYGHHMRRGRKKIIVKMLANFDTKNTLVKTTSKHSEIRFLPQYLITNMEIVFYKNKVFIAFWTLEPKGLLLESEEAVKSFSTYFDALWKIAKT